MRKCTISGCYSTATLTGNFTNSKGYYTEPNPADWPSDTIGGIVGARFDGKSADYTAVDAAIEKANTLNKSDYSDFSAVEAAISAVVRGKNITEQSKVDAMAKAIEDAIAGLVARPSSSGPASSSGSSKPSYSVTAPGTTENGSVTVSPKNATKGSTVTVTVKPDDGYQLDKLIVTDVKGGTISVTDKGMVNIHLPCPQAR